MVANLLEKVVNVYESTPRLIPKGSSPIKEVEKDLYDQYDADGSKRRLFDKLNETRIRPGDVVRVTKTDKSSFVGVLIAINRRHLSTNILLRTKIGGTGVEERFNIFNPAVERVETLRVPAKRRKRSKLYFIRENTKLDVGDVDAEIRKSERRRV
jgi:large subunit ribosomal protein L19